MIWLGLLFAVGSLAHATPNCTASDVLHNCAYLKKNASAQYVYLKDKTWFRNPEYDSNFWHRIYQSHMVEPSISLERRKQIVDLVNIAKQTIEDAIRNSRPDSALPEIDLNEIARIENIHFDINESLKDESTVCQTVEPQAYYSPYEHRFSICKSAMMLPDANLMFIIGHELGHSIDPCNIGFDLVETTPSQGKALKFRMKLAAISIFPQSDRNGPSRSQVVASSLPIDRYPQKSQMDCFVKEKMIQTLSSDEVHSLAVKATQILYKKVSANGHSEAENFEKNVESMLSDHPYCFCKEGKGNAIQETMADMWGTRVLAKFLKTHPPDSELAKIAIFGNFLDEICGPAADQTYGDNPHVPSRRRIDLVILSHPEIQSVLNCQPVASTPSCDSTMKSPAVSLQKADSTQ